LDSVTLLVREDVGDDVAILRHLARLQVRTTGSVINP
jgi:hypothetical protein